MEDTLVKNKAFILSEDEIKSLDNLKERYFDKYSLTLPALWIVQKKQGFVSIDSLNYLEKLLDIPAMHFYEVCSFYTMFNLEAKGKYHIKICKTLSCSLRGGKDILNYLKKRLGVSLKENTKDKLFTLDETECLGYCNEAPAMLCGYRQYKNLDINKVKSIIDEIYQAEKKC